MVKNVEIAQAPAYRHRAITLIARVIMPAPLRADIKKAIEAVQMPLYQCAKLRRAELWSVFKNKVLQACAAIINKELDGKRILNDIIKIMENENK